ncbi:MAG: hypothetical protein E6I94_11280 [Chloroflexi bacterium]|nr:MAG: hypothetical protein E6I94_11280 [Chloroflexota bacterium]
MAEPAPIPDLEPLPDAKPPAPMTEAVVEDVTPTTTPAGPSRVRRAGTALRRALPTVLTIALFTTGAVIGWSVATMRTAQPTAPEVASPVVNIHETEPAPGSINGMIEALNTNDSSLMVATMDSDALKQLRNAIGTLTHIEGATQGATVKVGSQTATAIQIVGTDTAGDLVAVDLVVHTNNGAIVGFR